MPRAKKKQEEEKKDNTQEIINLYFTHVISSLSKSDDKEVMESYVKKHRITSRIVEHKGKFYFSIFKRDKLIDQNTMDLFTQLKLK